MHISARSIAAIGAVGLGLANVGRIPGGAFGGRNAPVVAADAVVALLWCVLFFATTSRRIPIVIDGVMMAAGGFIATAAISTAFALVRYSLGVPEAAGILAFLVRWIAYFGWYPFVVSCLTADESRAAWRDVERALFAFAAFGIIQSAFLPGFAQMVHDGGDLPTWDIQGRRLVSTILDPNFAGILIVIALLFRLSRVAEGLRESMAALIVLAVAVALTLSRSALLALATGLVVIVAARGFERRLVRLLVGGAVLVLPFLSLLTSFAAGFNKLGYDASAAQRLVPWTRALRLVGEHPLFGIGFNAIKQAQESHGWRSIGGADVSLDGGLLFVAAMTGLVGVSVYVLMLSKVLRAARTTWRDSAAPADHRAHATATAAATVAVVVHSLFVNSLLLPFVMQVLWVMWGRLAHIRAANRARLGFAVVVPFALAVAGCDPCAGTVACSTSPQVTLSGTIVDHGTGVAVSGARIDVQVTGSGGSSAMASAITSQDGAWQVTIDAPTGPSLEAQIAVTSPGQPAYTVLAIPVRSSTRRGEATVLGLWNDVLAVRFLGTLIYQGVPLAGAQVHFAPQSEAGLTLAQHDATSNAAGIFELDFAGRQPEPIVGLLTVTHPNLSHSAALPGFSILLDYHFGIPTPRTTVPVGSILAYGGEVIFRGTGEKTANVGVEFVRTGGIETTPDHTSTTSNAAGFFEIDLTPATDGEVIGDLTLRPPAGTAAVYKNVHLATYDSVALRSFGVWAFGDAWAWAVELWRNDSLKPAPGVGAQFVRTGGVALASDTISGLTAGADGRIELRSSVSDTGFVNGNVIVFPTVGPPRVITGLRLHTNPDDQLHFAGVFTFGPALRYVGEVLTTDGAPVVGAAVQWIQTSGIAATPAVLNDTTDADGRFPLTLFPSADGGAIGQVRVQPAAPWPGGTEFVFNNLRLDTFLSPDLKLAVTYRIPAPGPPRDRGRSASRSADKRPSTATQRPPQPVGMGVACGGRALQHSPPRARARGSSIRHGRACMVVGEYFFAV